MLDFTSSLYLGFDHASSSLPGWTRLTLGKPAALEEPEGTEQVERELAALVGCEATVLGTSTLHLFWDLFGMLAEPGAGIFVEHGSYPIARWGVERAVAAGTPMRSFPRHDANALREAMACARRRPVVVTDGFCPAGGRDAPLAEYAECAAERGGLVVVDDTQALGIFGKWLQAAPPYGIGGGGSLWRLTRGRSEIAVVSSLAKGLGVPVAMLGGAARLVAKFRERSQTRVHCSPPTAAALAAARRALDHNQRYGDPLRRQLAERVTRFRRGLARLGLIGVPGCFPVQPLRLPSMERAQSVFEALLRRGVRAVLHRTPAQEMAGISFIVTARHRLSDIDRALEVLGGALSGESRGIARFGFCPFTE